MRTAYIIDYSNWAYRFQAACLDPKPHYVPGAGNMDFSALSGFLYALRQITVDEIYIAVDGTPLRARQLLPEYKAQRNHKAPERTPVPDIHILALLRHAAKSLNKKLRICCLANNEADDVIAYLVPLLLGKIDRDGYESDRACTLYNAQDDPALASLLEDDLPPIYHVFYPEQFVDEVIIGSADSDLYQLKRYGPVYFDTTTVGAGVVRTAETPKAVHGVPPYAIPLYKALLGDKSDNVPAALPSKFSAPLVRFMIGAPEALFKMFEFEVMRGCSTGKAAKHLNYTELNAPDIPGYFREKPEAYSIAKRNLEVVTLRARGVPSLLSYSIPYTAGILSLYKLD